MINQSEPLHASTLSPPVCYVKHVGHEHHDCSNPAHVERPAEVIINHTEAMRKDVHSDDAKNTYNQNRFLSFNSSFDIGHQLVPI